MPDVSGFPDGLKFIRFGAAKEDEFELLGGKIIKGVRPNAASGVIVEPAEGYTFQPSRWFDIRIYEFVDGNPNEFTAVKATEPTTIKVEGTYVVTNVDDAKTVRDALAKLTNLPGANGVTIE